MASSTGAPGTRRGRGPGGLPRTHLHRTHLHRPPRAEFPEHPTALTSLGLALLEMGQLKESLAAYHRAAKASPSDPLPVEKCAEIFERLGQGRGAVEQHGGG